MTCEVEFICTGCDIQVYSFGVTKVPDPPLCATCAFLATIEDPDERERVRAFLDHPKPYSGQARDGIEAQRGLNDTWPGDPYP